MWCCRIEHGYDFEHNSSSQIDRCKCRQYVAMCFVYVYIDRSSQLPFHIWLTSYPFLVFLYRSFSFTSSCLTFAFKLFLFFWKSVTVFNYVFNFKSYIFRALELSNIFAIGVQIWNSFLDILSCFCLYSINLNSLRN